MTTSAPTPQMLRGDEAQVFAAHRAKLERTVRSAVHAPDAVIEDACSHAWLQFLRCQPDRETVGGWLHTVAVRQAWDLAAREQRAQHYDAMPRHTTSSRALRSPMASRPETRSARSPPCRRRSAAACPSSSPATPVPKSPPSPAAAPPTSTNSLRAPAATSGSPTTPPSPPDPDAASTPQAPIQRQHFEDLPQDQRPRPAHTCTGGCEGGLTD